MSEAAQLGNVSYTSEYVTHCLEVEVYLPKHIQNLGALVSLLTDLIEPGRAHAQLIKKIDLGYDMGVPKSKPAPMSFPPDPKEKADVEPASVRPMLDKIQDGLVGYSIYEVDGAFRLSTASAGGTGVSAAHPKPGSVQARGQSRTIPLRKSKPLSATSEQLKAFTARDVNPLIGFIRDTKPVFEDDSLMLARPRPSANAVEVIIDDCIYWIDAENTDFFVTKCLRLYEERTLVIRFLIDLEKVERKTVHVNDEGLLEHSVDGIIGALLLIGHFLVNELGGSVGVEDEIWIYYDIGYLWKWRMGQQSSRQSLTNTSVPTESAPAVDVRTAGGAAS